MTGLPIIWRLRTLAVTNLGVCNISRLAVTDWHLRRWRLRFLALSNASPLEKVKLGQVGSKFDQWSRGLNYRSLTYPLSSRPNIPAVLGPVDRRLVPDILALKPHKKFQLNPSKQSRKPLSRKEPWPFLKREVSGIRLGDSRAHRQHSTKHVTSFWLFLLNLRGCMSQILVM